MQAPRNAKLLSFAFVLEVQHYIKKHELVCFLNSYFCPLDPSAPASTSSVSEDSPLGQAQPGAGSAEV